MSKTAKNILRWGLLLLALLLFLPSIPLLAYPILILCAFVVLVARMMIAHSQPISNLEDVLRPLHRHTRPQDIANEAMRAAGYKPMRDGVQVNDIGLLAYRGETIPEVHRNETILGSVAFIRPFVVVTIPHERGSEGTLKFEIRNEQSHVLFETEDHYLLKQGENFITPRAWLSLEEQAEYIGNKWILWIGVGSQVLAVHQIEVAITDVRTLAIGPDGEIQHADDLIDHDVLSLDELLRGQQERELRLMTEDDGETNIETDGDNTVSASSRRVRRYVSRLQRY